MRNKICKIEPYLHYVMMIKNQNILVNLMIFLIQLKSFMKSYVKKKQTSKTVIAELFSKISYKKEVSNKEFLHCEVNIFLETVTKSVNSQTNIKSSDSDSLTARFHKQLSGELSSVLKCLLIISYPIMFTFINPAKILAPWVLALEQDSYLSYIKNGDKEGIGNYRPISLLVR